jgi:hypothetical protein
LFWCFTLHIYMFTHAAQSVCLSRWSRCWRTCVCPSMVIGMQGRLILKMKVLLCDNICSCDPLRLRAASQILFDMLSVLVCCLCGFHPGVSYHVIVG